MKRAVTWAAWFVVGAALASGVFVAERVIIAYRDETLAQHQARLQDMAWREQDAAQQRAYEAAAHRALIEKAGRKP